MTTRKRRTPKVTPQELPQEEEPTGDTTAKYQIGFWNGLPNFGCPHCGYKTPNQSLTKGEQAIEEHIDKRHPVAWLEGV